MVHTKARDTFESLFELIVSEFDLNRTILLMSRAQLKTLCHIRRTVATCVAVYLAGKGKAL